MPQNVTTFQFRLIGDMTIKQFGYLAGGFILAYIAYKMPLPFFFTWPTTVLFALGGIGFAFVPIEERPMDVWFLSFIKSVYSPTQYVWQKQQPHVDKTQTAVTSKPSGIPVIGQIASSILNQRAHSHPQNVTKQAAPANTPQPQPTPQPEQSTPPQAQPVQQPPAPAGATTQQQPAPTTGQQPRQALADMFVNNHHAPSKAPSGTKFMLPDFLGIIKRLFSRPHPPQPTQQTQQTQQVPITPTEPVSQPQSIGQPSQQEPSVAPSTPVINQQGPHGAVTGKKVEEDAQPAEPQPTQNAAPSQEMLQAQEMSRRLANEVDQLKQQLQTKQTSEQRVLELQQQMVEVLEQRKKMEDELVALRRQVSTNQPQPQQPMRQASVATPQQPPQPTVKVITPDMAQKAGLPRLTTFPNIVTGILKDTQGNLLPGVLVTVMDNDGTPVRALKTNKLGQFAASTPLPNGVFTVEIEDPQGRFVFDRARITLNGTVVAPIEIVARSQKELSRAKLEKELFGTTQQS